MKLQHPDYGQLIIERVSAHDEDAVRAVQTILNEAARWVQEQEIDQWSGGRFPLRIIRETCGAHEVYLCHQEGDAAGTLTLQWTDPIIWNITREGDAAYLHRLAIRRQYKGIGRLLLAWAEGYAAGKGKSLMRLDCMAENKKLNRYYRDAGYTYVRRLEHSWWKANLYEKRID